MKSSQQQPGGCAIIFVFVIISIFGIWVLGNLRDCARRPHSAAVEDAESAARYEEALTTTREGMSAGAELAREETRSGALMKMDAPLELMAKSAAAQAGKPDDDQYWRAYVREYKAEWKRLHP